MKNYIYLLIVSFFVLTSCSQEEEIIDLASQNKPGKEKVSICHYDEENDTWHTITISENALKAHIGHGDRVAGGCEDYTYVPDDNFERALIDFYGCEDIMDDYVLTSNIDGITVLSLREKNIEDLTGIEDFTSLQTLNIPLNKLTSIDVSNNVNLITINCPSNFLSKLDVSGLPKLVNVITDRNLLTELDVSDTPRLVNITAHRNILTQINLSNTPRLVLLSCSINKLKNLDLSNNFALTRIYLKNNDLERLIVKNGNFVNVTKFQTRGNPLLSCIEVDDAAYSTANWTNIDSWTSFSEDCGY